MMHLTKDQAKFVNATKRKGTVVIGGAISSGKTTCLYSAMVQKAHAFRWFGWFRRPLRILALAHRSVLAAHNFRLFLQKTHVQFVYKPNSTRFEIKNTIIEFSAPHWWRPCDVLVIDGANDVASYFYLNNKTEFNWLSAYPAEGWFKYVGKIYGLHLKDNKYIPQEYIETLCALPDDTYKKYVEGKWDDA